MANEINWTGSFSCTNGKYSDRWVIQNSKINQLAQGAISGTCTTTTTEAQLDYGAVTSVGFLLMENLDSTNSVDFGNFISGTFHAIGTLEPGDNCIFRVKTGVAVYVKASAATPIIQYWLLQA